MTAQMKQDGAADSAGRLSLLDFSQEEMAGFLAQLGEPRYRARQVWEWIYRRYAADFEEMTNLPQGLRERLGAKATIAPLEKVTELLSASGDTLKRLYRLPDGQTIESV